MKPVLVVRIGDGRACAELRRGTRVLWAGEAAFTSPADLREVVAQLASEPTLPARPAGLRAELELPLAQLRTLHDLPPVRRRHLEALVATQAGRFFRKNGKPLVTAAAWPDRRRRGGTAMAAAVEEHWVQAILDGAEAGGVLVEAIGPAGLPATTRLQLLSAAELRRRQQQATVTLRRLAAAATLLWVAAGAAFVARLARERQQVEREIASLRAPVDAVLAARRALGDASVLVDTLTTAEQTRGLALRRLVSLSAALPDSAYVSSLALSGTEGEMGVVARRSSEVISGVERGALIATPQVRGAIVREGSQGREWERFTVRFTMTSQ